MIDLSAVFASNIRSATTVIAICSFSAIFCTRLICLISIVGKLVGKCSSNICFSVGRTTTLITGSGLRSIYTALSIVVTCIVSVGVGTNNINTAVHDSKVNIIQIKVGNVTIIVSNNNIGHAKLCCFGNIKILNVELQCKNCSVVCCVLFSKTIFPCDCDRVVVGVVRLGHPTTKQTGISCRN